MIVADYLASRAAVLKCATTLQEAAVGRIVTENDRLALQHTLALITFNHDGQIPYEVRILNDFVERAPKL